MGAEVYLCIEATNISIGAPPALAADKHTALLPPPLPPMTLTGDPSPPVSNTTLLPH